MSTLRCICAVLFVCGGSFWAQSPPPNQPELELSLEKAIEIALSTQGNTSVQLARESIHFARAQYIQARADLLPKVDGVVTEQNQTVNLKALGVQFPPSPQFVVPTEVGPYYTFDARPRLNQTLLNLSLLRRSQAARVDVHVAEAESDSTRERVASSVARLYAAALRANADVETAKANVSLAEALRDAAGHRQSVGEGTTLDSTRAQLSVSRNQQRLLAAQTASMRANLDLINALNVDWNTQLRLTGELGTKTADMTTAEQAVEVALKSRADFVVEQRRLESARLSHSAAQMQRLPSLNGYADYGVLSGVLTHTAGATLRLPLFDNRLEADRAQALSLVRQIEIRQKELRNRVELEVRQALASLASAQNQLEVADHAVALAEDELGRARRRYEAGLATHVEVVDAETSLENARNDRVAARFNCSQARIDLAQATGTITTISF